jgi:hypothetical protein
MCQGLRSLTRAQAVALIDLSAAVLAADQETRALKPAETTGQSMTAIASTSIR